MSEEKENHPLYPMQINFRLNRKDVENLKQSVTHKRIAEGVLSRREVSNSSVLRDALKMYKEYHVDGVSFTHEEK